MGERFAGGGIAAGPRPPRWSVLSTVLLEELSAPSPSTSDQRKQVGQAAAAVVADSDGGRKC